MYVWQNATHYGLIGTVARTAANAYPHSRDDWDDEDLFGRKPQRPEASLAVFGVEV